MRLAPLPPATTNLERAAVAPARDNLRRLVLLRYVLIVAILLGLGAAALLDVMTVSFAAVATVTACLLAINLATRYRLRFDAPVGNAELFVQLLLDVTLWSVVLVYSGGPTSPLGSLYLMPVVIAAVMLPRRLTWTIAVLTIGCYSVLFWRYFQMPMDGMGHGGGFEEHVLGMWATFVMSALLIAFFLERMARAVRDRERLLSRQREEQLRNERIVALGTMAVGAAHELGTPLTTMAVIAKDLRHECADNPAVVAELDTLRARIGDCKRIISELLASAGHGRAEGGQRRALDEYLDEIIAKWQVVRPAVACNYMRHGIAPTPSVVAEQTVSQAIMNLLNNAADASPHDVEVEGEWSDDRLRIEIRDRGPGLSREARLSAGEAFFSTKPPGEGIGIGLFLANATVERFGGRVGIFDREGGGACTLVEIPLAPLRAVPA